MLKLHKSETYCRVCKHQFNHHCLYVKVEQGGMQQQFIQPLEMVPCDSYMHFGEISSFNASARCGCIDWQPTDNLEYLELKANQADEKAFD